MKAGPPRPVDLVDLIHVRLDSHIAIVEMFAALCGVLAGGQTDPPQPLELDGLWEGMKVINQRLSEDAAAIKSEVQQLYEQLAPDSAR